MLKGLLLVFCITNSGIVLGGEVASQMIGDGAKNAVVVDLRVEKKIVSYRGLNETEIRNCRTMPENPYNNCVSGQVPVWKNKLVVVVRYKSWLGGQYCEKSVVDCSHGSKNYAEASIAIDDTILSDVELNSLKRSRNKVIAQKLFGAEILKKKAMLRTYGANCQRDFETGDFEHLCSPKWESKEGLITVIVITKK